MIETVFILYKFKSLFCYNQHTLQYDIREQMHVHTIIQAVCCWKQTEKVKKETENIHF